MKNLLHSLLFLFIILLLWLMASPAAWGQNPAVMLLTGSIDQRFAIEMRLERDGKNFDGVYFYDRIGRAISLQGTLDAKGRLHLEEISLSGQRTGSFVGTLIAGKHLQGTWQKAGSAHAVPFTLEVVAPPSTKQETPGGARIEEKLLRIHRPHPAERPEIYIRYPVVHGAFPATALRKLNRALNPRAIYEGEPGEKLSEDGWLDEIRYEVNYNKRSIFDITFFVNGQGAYPDTLITHRVFNLKTGNPIRAADVFAPAALRPLAELVNKSLQEEVREARQANNKDDSILSMLEGARFEVKDLDDFSVSDKGLTFIRGYGFPHAIKAAEPPGLFFYPYATLSPYLRRDGVLATFL